MTKSYICTIFILLIYSLGLIVELHRLKCWKTFVIVYVGAISMIRIAIVKMFTISFGTLWMPRIVFPILILYKLEEMEFYTKLLRLFCARVCDFFRLFDMLIVRLNTLGKFIQIVFSLLWNWIDVYIIAYIFYWK